MIWLSTPAVEALEVLAGAGNELVLLGDDYHERPVSSGLQTVRGPCWVAPDRGPGRRPSCLRIVAPDTLDELRHAGLVLALGARAMLTERGRRRIDATVTSCHEDASGGGEAGGVAAGAPDAS